MLFEKLFEGTAVIAMILIHWFKLYLESVITDKMDQGVQEWTK